MDAVVPLAGQIVQVLGPFMPYLVKAGQAIGAQAAQAGEEQARQIAARLWSRLGPHVEAAPSAREAAADLASQPDDADAQAALRLQLRKLLSEDQSLARDLAAILHEAGPTSTNVTIHGDRNVGIGRDVRGSTIITGDHTSPS